MTKEVEVVKGGSYNLTIEDVEKQKKDIVLVDLNNKDDLISKLVLRNIKDRERELDKLRYSSEFGHYGRKRGNVEKRYILKQFSGRMLGLQKEINILRGRSGGVGSINYKIEGNEIKDLIVHTNNTSEQL